MKVRGGRPKSFQIIEKSAKSLFLNGLSNKTMTKSEKSLFLNGLSNKSNAKVWKVFIFKDFGLFEGLLMIQFDIDRAWSSRAHSLIDS